MTSYNTAQSVRDDKVTSKVMLSGKTPIYLEMRLKKEAYLIFMRHYLEISVFAQAISQELFTLTLTLFIRMACSCIAAAEYRLFFISMTLSRFLPSDM